MSGKFLSGLFNARAAALSFRVAKYAAGFGAGFTAAAVLGASPNWADGAAWGAVVSFLGSAGAAAIGVYKGFSHRHDPAPGPSAP